ncbi:hypothetical protein GCK72_022926 [Caenorhabditis remanei]|uniref:Uncharacterized protein n=1 Tax=Caenorhabditis remanei TaxID=31234 RepID=A0A6A5FV12_CAERE|nr:hypothetical protein GCK72_022926 [Caenorhabditis remanei]KAF1746470.1 hypothetical protein GCK72_022926 [Caenorhabditis remanei]
MTPIERMQAAAKELDRVKNTIADFQQKHGNATNVPTWFLKITPDVMQVLEDSFSWIPAQSNSSDVIVPAAVPSKTTEQVQEIQDSLFFFELSQRSTPEVGKSLREIAVTLGKQEREMIRAAPSIPAWFHRLNSEQLAIAQKLASSLEKKGELAKPHL